MLPFPEQSSIFSGTPEQLLTAFKRLETLLPKVIPKVFCKAHKIQGDGGAGTIVEYVHAPEFAKGRTLKLTTEVLDEVNFILHFDLQIEGDSQYSSFKLHLQLFPGLLEVTTRGQWALFYEPDDAPPPLDIIATAHPCIVALSAYLQSEYESQSSSNASAELAASLPDTTPNTPSSEYSAKSVVEMISSFASAKDSAKSITVSIPSTANTEAVGSLTETVPSNASTT